MCNDSAENLCPNIIIPENPHLEYIRGDVKTGSVASFLCEQDYKLIPSNEEIRCSETGYWVGVRPHCEQINECGSNPCGNGATCTVAVNSYTCHCVAGYTGTHCETNINECVSNLCSNGATCIDAVNTYTCSCVDGYIGTHCETDFNECDSNLCRNGATCTDAVNSYSCHCVAGYIGTHCETEINECGSNLCENGATCAEAAKSYICHCVAGYTGTHCETDFNECGSNPCRNGATCTDAVNSYTCHCVAGYTGTHCETGGTGSTDCPKIYFNHRCFSGPFLSKGRITALPKSIGPGSMLINVAYKSSRILRELQMEGSGTPGMQQQVLKAKYKGKSYRAMVDICKTFDQIEQFCHQVCLRLECCPNLVSPHNVNGRCPERCFQLTKTKYTHYYGKKKKRKIGRPPGGHSNLENGQRKPGKRRNRKKLILTHRKKCMSTEGVAPNGDMGEVNDDFEESSSAESMKRGYDDDDDNSDSSFGMRKKRR